MKKNRCLINVETALALRAFLVATGGSPSPFLFLCPACKQPVRPNGGDNPTFTHVKANPGCPQE